MDDMIEKSAMRKIYIRLLPFAILSYLLAYIDRINASFAYYAPNASGNKPIAYLYYSREAKRRGGKDRDGSPDYEVLGLFGIGDQAGKQIAAVPAGKPGGDEPFQVAVQPGPQGGLEAQPDAVAGEPLGVTGGTAQ